MQIGLIADTHGLLRPEAVLALRGVDHILHAGDIGAPAVLDGLQRLAPVTAVRGNNDVEEWAHHLPESVDLRLSGVVVHMLHDISRLGEGAGPAQVIVSGHSHKPYVDSRRGVLYVNPGSAGPRRFTLPVCVALLTIDDASPRARIVPLALAAPAARKAGGHVP